MARNDEHKTPLHIAAAFGKPEHIYTLFSAGAYIMARAGYDYTPLHDAETSEAIKILLAAGADISAQSRNGFTPLHEAETLESIFALGAAGADVMAKEPWHNTPLHRAAANGTPATIKLNGLQGRVYRRKMLKAKRRCIRLLICPLQKTSKPYYLLVQTLWCKIMWGTLHHTSLLHA